MGEFQTLASTFDRRSHSLHCNKDVGLKGRFEFVDDMSRTECSAHVSVLSHGWRVNVVSATTPIQRSCLSCLLAGRPSQIYRKQPEHRCTAVEIRRRQMPSPVHGLPCSTLHFRPSNQRAVIALARSAIAQQWLVKLYTCKTKW